MEILAFKDWSSHGVGSKDLATKLISKHELSILTSDRALKSILFRHRKSRNNSETRSVCLNACDVFKHFYLNCHHTNETLCMLV